MFYKINILKCIIQVLSLSSLATISSCRKYLDAKSNINLEVPSTIQDLQALLDYSSVMNLTEPQFPESASDDYYVTYSNWETASLEDRSVYTWDASTDATYTLDWQDAYQIIAYANVVLDNVDNVSLGTGSIADYNLAKGGAFFFRANEFYNLSQEYSPPYNSTNAPTNYGICLRLTSSITAPSIRSTVDETYQQIVSDAVAAAKILPVTTSFPTRPNKIAAFGLLARVYLSMQDYVHASLYADSALQLNSSLLNLNTLNPSSQYPFSLFNAEVIFQSASSLRPIQRQTYSLVDSNLYSEYSSNDLRQSLYFHNHNFYGSYSGNYTYFNGIATDELYLIRSECSARAGNTDSALNDLNALLITRWKSGTYIPYSAASATQALQEVLTERRKELVYRCTRWSDLRRLNQDPDFAVTLTRNLNGQIYTLTPSDSRYTFLIPIDVISLTNMQQNPQ